jgi:hypothetical protein
MKLTVLIERNESGLLKAYVVQEGQRGANLIPRCTKLDTAKCRATDRLIQDIGQFVEITWEGVQE